MSRPVSLVQAQASTAIARAAIANLDVDVNPMSDPVSSGVNQDKGFHTNHKRYLHLTAYLADAGTTMDLELWLWDEVAELWAVDTRLGTVTVTETDGVYTTIVEIAQRSRVFVKLDNATGVWSTGASVWLSASEE